MTKIEATSLTQELGQERINPETIRPLIAKLITADNSTLVEQCRELGSTLTPAQISKLIPQMLDYGVLEDLCDRSKFALEVIVGASNPNCVVNESSTTNETLWECAYKAIRSRSVYSGSGATFTPINGITIPDSIIPDKDQARLPARDHATWH